MYRKGLEANKEKDKGENWGQYAELRPGEIYRGKEKWGKYLEK